MFHFWQYDLIADFRYNYKYEHEARIVRITNVNHDYMI